MAATNGLEKFSHLEDKIYRTIELTKALRQEKDDLERQLASARNSSGVGNLPLSIASSDGKNSFSQ